MPIRYKIDIPLDRPERTLLHRRIILSKSFLRKLYVEWYESFIRALACIPPGPVVELGSGGGFFKDLYPSVLSSDVLPLITNDITFSAMQMPLRVSSVSGICMIDTFHHLPDVSRFLSESERVLKTGGKLLMIEPASSAWGKLVYTGLHHEAIDPRADWRMPSSGPLSGANIALPWIVFIRDRALFERCHPRLQIERVTYHTPLRYLLSGGVSFSSFAPSCSFLLFRRVDRALVSLSRQLSMFMTISVRKI